MASNLMTSVEHSAVAIIRGGETVVVSTGGLAGVRWHRLGAAAIRGATGAGRTYFGGISNVISGTRADQTRIIR